MGFMPEIDNVIEKTVDQKMDDLTEITQSIPKDISDRIFSLSPLKADLFARYMILTYMARSLRTENDPSWDDICKLLTTEQERQDLLVMIGYILTH